MPRVATPPDVRSAILDAATGLMERHGYRKMTIDDIARAAGIGKATIYGYFPNKQEVGLAVIEGYREEVRTKQRQIMDQPMAPPEKIRRLVIERVLAAFEISARYRDSQDDSLATLKPIVIRRRGRHCEEEARMLAEAIGNGVEEGLFRSEDPLATARTILTCISGLMPYGLSYRELVATDDVAAQTNQVLDLVFQGLLATPGRQSGSESRSTNSAEMNRIGDAPNK